MGRIICKPCGVEVEGDMFLHHTCPSSLDKFRKEMQKYLEDMASSLSHRSKNATAVDLLNKAREIRGKLQKKPSP